MNNISLYQVPLQKYVDMMELQIGISTHLNDKTTRELPPGLVPITNKEDESELYKPKVSTWGVFRRPGNLSKTFSGGRVICPGEVLESKEEKIVKEARTKQLLAAYNKKTGLNVDPKLKFEYEEVSIYSDHQILLRLFPSFIHGFPFYAHCWAFFLS
ncbi:hypothetical protein JHK82_012097 [Glycine max]|uniref:Uncharacterized protein n=1 Tax=Glycine soja TaxID=3848 RepID=A0A0B2SBS8_GLYSO|nr:hypothetical protein JHK85_012421 [Glycine max]KAG5057097.1 hypothetical protein JHK86_012093 [Glycine max]KAG5154128.1 hypothetical protein JHK82_012097 [Glycine max]KHN44206.1 hypothetical protein glysoja_045697 [Glycine soja]